MPADLTLPPPASPERSRSNLRPTPPATAAPDAAVFVIDDDAVLRRSIAAALHGAGLRSEVYGSADEFLEAARSDRPGCLLVDLRLPGMSGLQLIELVRQRGWLWPMIVISGFADVPTAVKAMQAGAVDVLQKPFNTESLLERVRAALLEDARRRAVMASIASTRALLDSLTDREREVMGMVVNGMPSKQIAAELGLSIKTVEYHRTRIMTKLRVTNVAELVHVVCMAKVREASVGAAVA